MPNSTEGRKFSYSPEYEVQTRLEYIGREKTDLKNLQIGNQGGTIAFRISNTNLGEYYLDNNEKVIHDGTILAKKELKQDDIKFNISFDFIIEVKNTSYKTNIKLDLPTGDIINEGISNEEITEKQELIFKR